MDRAQQIQKKNDELKAIILRARIDKSYTYRADDLLNEKIRFLADNCKNVLDVGKSSRERFAFFRPGQITTLDINQFDGYPDILDDLCDIQNVPAGSKDGIICMAVLEHVYDPASAVTNLHKMLQSGGYCLAYVPFLYRYHSGKDLVYQDYFRYTRDGIAYLFRDFSDVTLYPCRGRLSTMLNLLAPWKHRVEAFWGQRLNKWIDRAGSVVGKGRDELQASGYYIWATK